MMDENELAGYVVKHLGESDKPDDLIFDLCEKTGWHWQQAEAFVRKVEQEREPEIARRQLPILFFIALVMFLGGLTFASYALYSIFDAWFLASATAGNGQPLNISSGMFVIINAGAQVFHMLLVGLCMIFGSLLGMRNAWSAVLSR
jgi:hypothetical protein